MILLTALEKPLTQAKELQSNALKIVAVQFANTVASLLIQKLVLTDNFSQ